MRVVDVLLANLDQAYDGKGWHGPTLRSALRGLSVDQLVWRPAKNRHNIWELTSHCAYWKYAVRRKLTGAKRGSFPMKGSNWFASPADSDERRWQQIVSLLEEEHRQLRAAIETLPKSEFEDPKRLRLMYGVAAHDLYHAGQVRLLKRLQSS